MKARIRRGAGELATICLWAVVGFIALWSLGAAAGIVMLGFCMVAGCR